MDEFVDKAAPDIVVHKADISDQAAVRAAFVVGVATKGAIHALTRAMALDHAVDNIRVNSLSPGSVRTPMLAVAARGADGPDASIETVFRRFGAAHPLGRIGEPNEVAEMIALLAGPRGSFCTGGDYRVDGGLTAGIGVR